MKSNYRSQNLKVQTGKRQVYLFVGVTALLVAIALILLVAGIRKGYRPPDFDTNAKQGTPSPDEGYLYDTVETNFGYKFGIAANLYQQEDGSVNAFFTNPSSNTVNLVCEISSKESGDILYKTGVIRPGEYVASISRFRTFANEVIPINITVYAFESDTWYSAGTTSISTILQAW